VLYCAPAAAACGDSVRLRFGSLSHDTCGFGLRWLRCVGPGSNLCPWLPSVRTCGFSLRWLRGMTWACGPPAHDICVFGLRWLRGAGLLYYGPPRHDTCVLGCGGCVGLAHILRGPPTHDISVFGLRWLRWVGSRGHLGMTPASSDCGGCVR
jgi:hypothetical protein